MKRATFTVMFVACAVGCAMAEVVCEETVEAWLDLRKGTRHARIEEPIVFSTGWSEGVTRLVLNVDGANVLMTTSATNGVYVWKPDFATSKSVTLKHTTRGKTNEVMTATFSVESFEVRFESGSYGTLDGGAAVTQRVPYGYDAAPPAVRPYEGYEFTGWNPMPINITSAMTCVAQYAAIGYVFVDAVNGDDDNDGSMEDVAVRTLARAYELAEAGDVIQVAAGTYEPVTAQGKRVTFRAPNGATIDGDGEVRCVTADGAVVFENFTLVNGYDEGAGGGAKGGTFDHCTITNCTSAFDGGGAYESVLRNCVIVGNKAESGMGGGAYESSLVNCTVTGNESGDIGGGVCAPKELTNCVVSGNYPDDVAEWEGAYTIKFLDSNGGELRVVSVMRDTVYQLPRCEETPPQGRHFAGWMGSNGRRYDDGVMVFNLASGETITMKAIWE